MKACRDVGEQVFKLARQMEDSPLANVDFERVAFADGCIAVAGDPEPRGAAVVLRVRAVAGLEDAIAARVAALWDEPAAAVNGTTHTITPGE